MLAGKNLRGWAGWLGIAWLAGGLAGLVGLSTYFGSSEKVSASAIGVFVLLYMLAGTGFFMLVYRFFLKNKPMFPLWILFLSGLFLRLVFIQTPAILEIDFYRYFWDGAVTANGMDPYRYAPADVMERANSGQNFPEKLVELADKASEVLPRINFPEIRTIYTPLVQLAFAGAYRIKPFSLDAWRLVLLLIDICNFLLLLKLLKKAARPVGWIGIYWLNPLVIKEIFNSGHMDILIFPFLLSAFLLALDSRPLLTGAMLGLAASVKLWPLAIFPFMAQSFKTNRQKILLFTIIFAVVFSLLVAPLFVHGLDNGSSIKNYSQRWENNDAAFRVIHAGWASILPVLHFHSGHAQKAARLTVVLLIALWGLVLWRRENMDFVEKSLLMVTAIFLLSPTAFPWYAVWMMPLLAVHPNKAALLLVVLLPLYYTRYYFETIGRLDLFNHLIVWIEFAPVWWLILARKMKKQMLTE